MAMNPFKPTAGKNPPVLIGRDAVLDQFEEGIDNGPGAPDRLMRITGARGMGKTVMLNEIGSLARNRGWALIEETASEGMCDRILAEATPKDHVAKFSASPTILGVSLGGIDVERASLSLRGALANLAKKNGSGVLITLDEVQDASIDEMRALSVAIQHLIREDQSIAFVFAGLPSMIENVVNGKTLTFLRRAVPVDLGPVSIAEVAASLEATMGASGMTIDDNVASLMAQATHGYPFMIQLVGYHTWQTAHNAGTHKIDAHMARQGIRIARERFNATVIEPALQRVSDGQLEYLLAMAQDDGRPSFTSRIAERLGKTVQQLSATRARLFSKDIIESPSRGMVNFAIPHLAQYLNERRGVLEGYLADRR